MTIDTEQDVDAEYRHTGTYRNIDVGIPKLLEIFDNFSVKATWLVTPDVAINRANIVKKLAVDSHEIGSHIHPEFFFRNNLKGIRPKQLISDFSYEQQKMMIQKATQILQESVGINAISFRGGRFGVNLNTMRCLKDQGYLIDTSVTPNINWAYGANWLDYTLSCFDFSGILEVPVTIVKSMGTKFWLRPSISDLHVLNFVAHKAAAQSRPLLLNMMFHSMETIDPNYYIKSEIFFKRLKDFLKVLSSENVRWVTLQDIQAIINGS